jgi:hypothetical protein
MPGKAKLMYPTLSNRPLRGLGNRTDKVAKGNDAINTMVAAKAEI